MAIATPTQQIVRQGANLKLRPAWLDTTLYPFESRYISIEGQRIHYIDEGAGPVILFVHGTASWSFLYRDIIQNLRNDFRCIALDWPGFGLSEATPDFKTTLAGNSRLLDKFIAELGLQDVTIYGHDAAAAIALGVVGRKPELFRAIIAANAFGFPLEGEFPGIVRFLKVVRTRLFRTLIVRFNFLQRITNASGLRHGKLTVAERRAYLAPTVDRSRRRHHWEILAGILDAHDYLVDMEQRLQAVKHLPVLLTFGNTDGAYKAGFVPRWQQSFPNNRVFIIDGGTHFPQEDDPQGIANAIRSWWQEVVEAQS